MVYERVEFPALALKFDIMYAIKKYIFSTIKEFLKPKAVCISSVPRL